MVKTNFSIYFDTRRQGNACERWAARAFDDVLFGALKRAYKEGRFDEITILAPSFDEYQKRYKKENCKDSENCDMCQHEDCREMYDKNNPICPKWPVLFVPTDSRDVKWIEKHAEEVAEFGFIVYRNDWLGVYLGINGGFDDDFFDGPQPWIQLYRAMQLKPFDSFVDGQIDFAAGFSKRDTPDIKEMEANNDVKSLIEALGYKDEVALVRWGVVEALGEIGDDRAVEPLIKALKDEDVRMVVLWALGNIGDERAVKPLIEVLKGDGTPNYSVIWRATDALVTIGEPAVEPLILALKDEDVVVRDVAASALGKIGDGRAVEPLINALNDVDREVRTGAVYALGRIGDDGAVEPLVHSLRDASPIVRRDAAWALGEIGDGRAVEPIIQALNDEDKYVRWGAAEALGEIGDKSAIEPLIQALRDDDPDVRRAVKEALDRMKKVISNK